MNRWIKIITDFEGLHCWGSCDIETVGFLKNPHRHKIYVTVFTEVNPIKDRCIEFFCFKREVDLIIDKLYGIEKLKNLGQRSMETISDEIHTELSKLYPNRRFKIEVSEDGQVGSFTEYD